MSDYRRILSYLYCYENREKKDCKGFIKAEQRNGALKLTIQILDEHLMEGMKLNLCFYQKVEEHWRVWMLDQLSMGAGQEETVLSYNKESLPDAFDIRNQYGVILYYQDALYYGSVWIGEDIPIGQLSAEQWSGMDDLGDHQPEKRRTDEKQEPDKKATVGNSQTKAAKEAAKGNSQTTTERKPAKGASQTTTEGKTAKGALQTTTEGKPAKGASQTITEEAVKEDPQTKAEEKVVKENSQRKAEEKTVCTNKQDDSELKITEQDTVDTGEDFALTECRQDLLEPIRDQAPAAEKIFNSAFHEGYQISTAQLMQLGEEADALSENQFLLKGYGRYHHLLAGKVRYDGADRYCVGVPGVYENREKYMAQLYQFPVFLSLTENRIKTGRFGYWLHILS